jgi:uncharacterized membrane protein
MMPRMSRWSSRRCFLWSRVALEIAARIVPKPPNMASRAISGGMIPACVHWSSIDAFAAFPVMTAAIGLPFVVGQFGGNPAIVCAIGMLAGFCGTLMTPMAANFNVVPANLLELPDRNAALNGVIRAQLPTALIMLGVNMALMYFLAFRF